MSVRRSFSDRQHREGQGHVSIRNFTSELARPTRPAEVPGPQRRQLLENLPPPSRCLRSPSGHDGGIELLASGSYWASPNGGFCKEDDPLGHRDWRLCVRRFMYRQPVPVVKTNAVPTLADQLLLLVEAALSGSNSAAGRWKCCSDPLAAEVAACGPRGYGPVANAETRVAEPHRVGIMAACPPGNAAGGRGSLLSPYRTAAAINSMLLDWRQLQHDSHRLRQPLVAGRTFAAGTAGLYELTRRPPCWSRRSIMLRLAPHLAQPAAAGSRTPTRTASPSR
jgi:hypothetical protein